MEGDEGAQVAGPSTVLHQSSFPAVSSPAAKKRQSPESAGSDKNHVEGRQFMIVSASGDDEGNRNTHMRKWDGAMSVAKPSSGAALANKKGEDLRGLDNGLAEEVENLGLNMGSESPPVEVDDQLGGPHKKVKSGSPGSGSGSASGGSYPVCQVDDCKSDLSKAKDYLRRHKVCDAHSKSIGALIGNELQRFCQQCSRFHPLSEFDEERRSCRGRLAGHNRRRRKVQPENIPSSLLSNEQNYLGKKNSEITTVLSILAHLQGNNLDHTTTRSIAADKLHFTGVFRKMNSAPTINSCRKLPFSQGLDLNISVHQQSAIHDRVAKESSPTPPTLDLLGVLSTALGASDSDNVTTQGSSNSNSDDSELRKCIGPCTSYLPGESGVTCPHPEVGRRAVDQASSITVPHSGKESKFTPALQLFDPAEDDITTNAIFSKKYLHSYSSDHLDNMSPSLSRSMAQCLFLPRCETKSFNNGLMKDFVGDISIVPPSTSPQCSLSLSLWNNAERKHDNDGGCLPCQAACASAFDFDHSPSNSHSNSRDQTDHIIVNLFDKDTSDMPASFKAHIAKEKCTRLIF